MLRSELMRPLPPDVEEIKPFLTDEVLDLYDSLCEVYLWGDWRGEDLHVSTGESTSWEPADPRVERIKEKVDHYLSSPRVRLGGSRKIVERQLKRDMRRIATWLFDASGERLSRLAPAGQR